MMAAVGALAVTTVVSIATATAAATETASCPPSQPTAGAGVVDPFRPPTPAATALNAAAKPLYRQGKWDEARAKYHAAEVADPEFLAPALNIACSFVRQERFAEATGQVMRLLDHAFIPWSREILTAADLGALKAQPQMAQIQRALADGAGRWGAGLETDLLFVARQREPLKLPPAAASSPAPAEPVVLVLGLHQEVFAWSPLTMRYRQITAQDGRVLAMAQSTDRRTLLYVTAEKLVRRPHAPDALRGLTLHTLTLTTMAPAISLPLEGDIVRLAIAPTARGFAVAIDGDKVRGTFAVTDTGTDTDRDTGTVARGQLVAAHALDEWRLRDHLVVLTSGGVTSPLERPLAGLGSCQLVARQTKNRDGFTTIAIARAGDRARRTALTLRPRFGAALAGLSIP